jgi:hypothetical protein
MKLKEKLLLLKEKQQNAKKLQKEAIRNKNKPFKKIGNINSKFKELKKLKKTPAVINEKLTEYKKALLIFKSKKGTILREKNIKKEKILKKFISALYNNL